MTLSVVDRCFSDTAASRMPPPTDDDEGKMHSNPPGYMESVSPDYPHSGVALTTTTAPGGFRQDEHLGHSPPDLPVDHEIIQPDDGYFPEAIKVPYSDEELHAQVAESLLAPSDTLSSSDERRGMTDNGYESTWSARSPPRKPPTTPPRSLRSTQPSIPAAPVKAPYHMSILTRMSYGAISLLPLMGAVGLFTATAAPFFWYRSHLSIIRINIPPNVWNSDHKSTSSLNMNAGGTLSMGIWGWCFESIGNTQAVCSDTKLWYDMSAFFKQAGETTTTLTERAFDVNLIRALITHIIAGGCALVALGLVTWHIYARYCLNDNRVDPNWRQHGSCFIAFWAGVAADIVDLLCRKSFSKHSPKSFEVEQGSIPFFTLIAFLLLLLAFFASYMPALFSDLRQKHSYGHYKSKKSGPFALTADVDDEVNVEDEVNDHLSRRRSIWQRGVDRVTRQSLARVRTRHQGLGSDGATRLVERHPSVQWEDHKGYTDEAIRMYY